MKMRMIVDEEDDDVGKILGRNNSEKVGLSQRILPENLGMLA